LFAAFSIGQVRAYVLGLDITERELVALAGYDVVRRAARRPFWLVGGDDFIVEGFQQVLQSGPVSMFSSITAFEGAIQFPEVISCRRIASAAATVCRGLLLKQIVLDDVVFRSLIMAIPNLFGQVWRRKSWVSPEWRLLRPCDK